MLMRPAFVSDQMKTTAVNPAKMMVTLPTAPIHGSIAGGSKGNDFSIKTIPAATSVAECKNEETGVGPAIAPESQL